MDLRGRTGLVTGSTSRAGVAIAAARAEAGAGVVVNGCDQERARRGAPGHPVSTAARIRAARPDDAAAIADLYRRSVTGIGPRDYAPEQVTAWAGRSPSADAVAARNADGRTVLVAVDDDDRPIAFGDLEPDGHIDFLYCAPEAVGRGIASAVYDRLEEVARAAGATRLHVEASEAARRLFTRKGFRVTARRDLEIDGVAIHNFAMEKHLG